jgi:hypothetical protein
MACKFVSNIISSLITVAVVATIVIYALRKTDHYDVVPREGQEVIEKIEKVAKTGMKNAVKAAEPHVRQILGETKNATMSGSSPLKMGLAVALGALATLAVVIVLAVMVRMKIIMVPGVDISNA